MTDATPACKRVSQAKTDNQRFFLLPNSIVDLKDRKPCDYCFPNTDHTSEIEEPPEHLVVARTQSATVVHINEGIREIDWSEARPPETEKTLAKKIQHGEIDHTDVSIGGGD